MRDSSPVAAVVVGVDGSEHSWPAVTVAAWEARARGAALVIAHGYLETYPYAAYGWAPYLPFEGSQKEWAHKMLDELAARVHDRHPDLAVETHLVPGGGSPALIRESWNAGLLVVGARGHGGFGGLSIGSIAAQVAAHAACTVVVVRPPLHGEDPAAALERRRGLPVLVGIDGSEESRHALQFAFEEARLRGVGVIASYVWWFLPHDEPPPQAGYDPQRAREEARGQLDAVVAPVAAQFPDIEVTQRVEHGMDTSHRLIELSDEAGLTVVGCRGRGGFAGLLLGSTSRDLVGHAASPVAVVHTHSS